MDANITREIYFKGARCQNCSGPLSAGCARATADEDDNEIGVVIEIICQRCHSAITILSVAVHIPFDFFGDENEPPRPRVPVTPPPAKPRSRPKSKIQARPKAARGPVQKAGR